MRVPDTEYDLSPTELGEFASLAIVKRFRKFLEGYARHD
jgi:hypothetical protein